MATTKTREELVRMAWVTALRQQGDRQCHGMGHYKGSVCALMLAGEVAGLSERERTYSRCASAVGLSDGQCGDVMGMNDGINDADHKHTFSEIADVVESWFSKVG